MDPPEPVRRLPDIRTEEDQLLGSYDPNGRFRQEQGHDDAERQQAERYRTTLED